MLVQFCLMSGTTYPGSVGSWAKIFPLSQKHRAELQSAALSPSHLYHHHHPVTSVMRHHSLGSSVGKVALLKGFLNMPFKATIMTDIRQLLNMTQQVISNMQMSAYLLDQREKDFSHVAEAVFLDAVKDVSSASQSSHFIDQTLLTTLL